MQPGMQPEIKAMWRIWAVLTALAGLLSWVAKQPEPILGALVLGILMALLSLLAWWADR